MNTTERFALIWYEAEYPGIKWTTINDRLAEGVPRVRKVFSGEVRWSEASPGDKAVWVGRPRNVEQYNSNPHRDQWVNLYDTADFEPRGDKPRTNNGGYEIERLFGPINIGCPSLCNSQYPNLFCSLGHGGNCEFAVHHFHIVPSRYNLGDVDCTVTLTVGAFAWFKGPLAEAVLGVPVMRTIPERQNFEVSLWVNTERLESPIRLVAHLEGIDTNWTA